MQAAQVQVGQLERTVDSGGQHLDVDAKLVLGSAGGDVAVGVGVDVGVDAYGHMGRFASPAGQLVDDLELGHRLNIEAEDVVIEPQVDLPVGLAHARIHHLARVEASCKRGLDFAAAHQVDAQAIFHDFFQNHGVAVGLDGIVHIVGVALDLAVDFVECLAEQAHVVVVERRGPLLEFF